MVRKGHPVHEFYLFTNHERIKFVNKFSLSSPGIDRPYAAGCRGKADVSPHPAYLMQSMGVLRGDQNPDSGSFLYSAMWEGQECVPQ